MSVWTEPTIDWQTVPDDQVIQERLASLGDLIATWPAAPFESSATYCYRVGDEYWIWQPSVGGIRFSADRPALSAYPARQIDRDVFECLVTQSWLPAIYQVWCRQVLHASAVAYADGNGVIAFTGPSCAGKSTTAYGLSRRPWWHLVTDDTLAFSIEEDAHSTGVIPVHPLRNRARLRTATAAYYGQSGPVEHPIEWPQRPLTLSAVCVLTGDAALCVPARFDVLTPSESYLLLLAQANALTLQIPKFNQRLMRDYLTLAATIPVVRLTYRQSFEDVETVYDAIDAYCSNLDPERAPHRRQDECLMAGTLSL